MKRWIALGACLWGLCVVARAQEAPPDSAAAMPVKPAAPASSVSAADAPNDNGHALVVTFTPSADDHEGGSVLGYEVYRSGDAPDAWDLRGTVPAAGPAGMGAITYRDAGAQDVGAQDYFAIGKPYQYRIRTLFVGGYSDSAPSAPVGSTAEWFHMGKIELFAAIVIFTLLMVVFIGKAKKGADLYIRPLAGIDAVDEAIGRATEMGRPILYVLGLGTASDISTIAAFTVLGRVAKKVAEYNSKIIVPCYDPIVMAVAQETVKAGFLDAGRPDMYREDDVYFVTQSQFAYIAAVNGTMMRELPATNFYLGLFYAESLLLAETGAMAGSIQIAGTDEVTQIPFFVVACDYTLIGEELYAASAYLGREPLLMGTLKAQDWSKGAFVVAMLIGLVATLAGWATVAGWFHLSL
jgi:uncharacterized protein DUF6754